MGEHNCNAESISFYITATITVHKHTLDSQASRYRCCSTRRYGQPALLRGGVAEHPNWINNSDHRLLWVDNHFPFGGTEAKLIQSYDLSPITQLDRKYTKMVEFFQRLVEKKMNRE